MSENQYWKDHVQPKLSPFGKLVRIENSLNRGTPDVAYCLRARPSDPAAFGWVELKHLDAPPARPSSPLSLPKLRPEQVDFLEGWRGAGGVAWLLLRCGDAHLLFDGLCVRPIYERRWTFDEATQQARLAIVGRFPTGRVLRCLTSG